MAKKLFGTDGIRGVPGTYPLDDTTLERVGVALGKYLAANAKGSGAGRPPRGLDRPRHARVRLSYYEPAGQRAGERRS